MKVGTGDSWIVVEAAARVREKYGVFRWDQYPLFCGLVGVKIRWERPSELIPASLCDGVLSIDPNLAPDQQAFAAWHEIAHLVMHEGDRRDWEGTFDGEAMIRKCERQANEFARMYPVWPTRRGIDEGFAYDRRASVRPGSVRGRIN